MKINATTLMLEDLTEVEAGELLALARTIAREGKVDWENPLLKAWMAAGSFKDSQQLMVVSTVFPMRAFDSVLIALGK